MISPELNLFSATEGLIHWHKIIDIGVKLNQQRDFIIVNQQVYYIN